MYVKLLVLCVCLFYFLIVPQLKHLCYITNHEISVIGFLYYKYMYSSIRRRYSRGWKPRSRAVERLTVWEENTDGDPT